MKRIKGNKKLIIGLVLGIFISAVTSYAVAETLIKSADVSYVDNSKLGATNVQAAIDGTCTKFSNDLATLLDKMYPIGSIYISTTLSTPTQVGSAIGGTWESYGKGQTLVGVDTSQTEFNTISKTGGAKSVSTTLKEANLPAHTHDISHTHTTSKTTTTTLSLTAQNAGEHSHSVGIISDDKIVYGNLQFVGDRSLNTVHLGYEEGFPYGTGEVSNSGAHTHNVTGSVTIPSLSTDSISTTKSGTTGSGTAFSTSTLQPYITVYMYKRTK